MLRLKCRVAVRKENARRQPPRTHGIPFAPCAQNVAAVASADDYDPIVFIRNGFDHAPNIVGQAVGESRQGIGIVERITKSRDRPVLLRFGERHVDQIDGCTCARDMHCEVLSPPRRQPFKTYRVLSSLRVHLGTLYHWRVRWEEETYDGLKPSTRPRGSGLFQQGRALRKNLLSPHRITHESAHAFILTLHPHFPCDITGTSRTEWDMTENSIQFGDFLLRDRDSLRAL